MTFAQWLVRFLRRAPDSAPPQVLPLPPSATCDTWAFFLVSTRDLGSRSGSVKLMHKLLIPEALVVDDRPAVLLPDSAETGIWLRLADEVVAAKVGLAWILGMQRELVPRVCVRWDRLEAYWDDQRSEERHWSQTSGLDSETRLRCDADGVRV